MTLSVSGATPGGLLGIIAGSGAGGESLPAGVCAGTQTALAAPLKLLGGQPFPADAYGLFQTTRTAPQNACSFWIQVVDLGTCRLSNPLPLP